MSQKAYQEWLLTKDQGTKKDDKVEKEQEKIDFSRIREKANKTAVDKWNTKKQEKQKEKINDLKWMVECYDLK